MKKQAKLTSKTKYYAADVPQFFKAANFGENYSYYKVKHLRKLTKAQFFASSSICYKYYGKNYYKDMESSLAITVKNGEVTRIVQYGHVAG